MEKTRENILETICIDKWNEVARQKEELPLARLQQAIRLQRRPVLSLKQALAASPTGIIAEFKRRSPSRGWIAPAADVTAITAAYQQAGAAAVSCLTDEHFFCGSLSDFEKARAVITRVPLLRKEFIVDEYQVYQSRVMGADAILLIAACLWGGLSELALVFIATGPLYNALVLRRFFKNDWLGGFQFDLLLDAQFLLTGLAGVIFWKSL